MKYKQKIEITLERRDDGGLRIYSDDVPGLILSGRHPDRVMGTILDALNALKAWEENHESR